MHGFLPSGRTIFVGHEWLGWNHADPNGEQFKALKRILQRLMRGEVPKVESNWKQQIGLKQNTIVTAAEWKAALLYMFVWFDFRFSLIFTDALIWNYSRLYFVRAK